MTCGCLHCWWTKHKTKERLSALRKKTAIWKFIPSTGKEDSDVDERQLTDALEEVNAHIVESTGQDGTDELDDN